MPSQCTRLRKTGKRDQDKSERSGSPIIGAENPPHECPPRIDLPTYEQPRCPHPWGGIDHDLAMPGNSEETFQRSQQAQIRPFSFGRSATSRGGQPESNGVHRPAGHKYCAQACSQDVTRRSIRNSVSRSHARGRISASCLSAVCLDLSRQFPLPIHRSNRLRGACILTAVFFQKAYSAAIGLSMNAVDWRSPDIGRSLYADNPRFAENRFSVRFGLHGS